MGINQFGNQYGYGYEFGNGFDSGMVEGYASDAFATGAGFVIAFLLVFYLVILAACVAMYVIQAISLHSIGKRRGIHHSWLAWVPIGNMWLLGSISDQYQYFAKNRVTNRRKILLGLSAGIIGLGIFMSIQSIVNAIISATSSSVSGAQVGGGLALTFLLSMAVIVIAIVGAVFEYIALYDLFRSCEPSNSVLYLVLSIFFGVALPVCLLICKNKDLGMPPKKTPQHAEPEVQPVIEAQPAEKLQEPDEEPVQEPVQEQPPAEE